MADSFDWQHQARPREREINTVLPPPDRVGWWMVISLLTAIVIHIVLFITLGHVKLNYNWTASEEIITGQVVVRPVEEETEELYSPAPDEEIPAPKPDQASLLDDVEILQQLEDPELEMKPDIDVASYDVAVKLENPALSGDPSGDIAKLTSALEVNESELDTLGKNAIMTPSAADGQMIVDPGAELADKENLDAAMEALIKKGAGGLSANGVVDGTTSLDEIAGLPTNVLVTKTTMLPGDLLFEFNSDKLRSSARIGMQKIALVMDLNPDLYCWIDGHTDLIGTDAANDELSRRRSQSVKNYLIGIGMNSDKIITRGFGESRPIILSGDQEQQAANRRVELKMRKTAPSQDDAPTAPLKAAPVIEQSMPQSYLETSPPPPVIPEEAPPKAILVKPLRAMPIQEIPPPPTSPAAPELPRRAAVQDDSDPAIESGVVEQISPLRAEPVEE